MAVIVRDVTWDDIETLSETMRECDRQEVYAASGHTPLDGLRHSVSVTHGAKAGLVDDELVAIFGTAPVCVLGNVGVPWLLGADCVAKHAVPFLRLSRQYIAYVGRRYSVLTNHVDARNTTSIDWLEWLGFELFEAEPFGPFHLPFHRFEMRF